MYTNPLLLKIRNLEERVAAITILANISKLSEKKLLKQGVPFSIKAASPRMTPHTAMFIIKNIAGLVNLVFDEKGGRILATITPK